MHNAIYIKIGGNMRNNVIIALHNYFASKGFITACVNFRQVIIIIIIISLEKKKKENKEA